MIEKQRAIMLFGPQGAGKGTQKALLREWLEENTQMGVIDLELGVFFRSLVSESGHTNDLVRDSLRKGNLQPDFLSSYGATEILINQYTGREHIIADGFPRKALQAELFHQMLDFYGLSFDIVVLELSEEESVKRLLLRGREDDTEAGIKQRLGWYHDEVMPLLAYFRKFPNHYNIVNINGAQSIDMVFSDIKQSLALF